MEMMLYVLKFLWYIFKYLIIGMLIAAILIAGFFVARETANVYIIVTEGMEARAGTILNLTQLDELDKYFIANYAVSDAELSTDKYDEFFIRDFDYKLKIESLWASPWENTAYVRAVESVPEIDGEYPTEDENEVPRVMPKWQSARYTIYLVKIDGAWYISQAVKTDMIDETQNN